MKNSLFLKMERKHLELLIQWREFSLPTYLRIKKQRYLCENCGKNFTAQTPIVKRNCFISNYINAESLNQSRNVQSVKDIANDTNVSETSVQRVLTKEGSRIRSPYHPLPDHMSFDEFKYASGRMAFEYINAETGDILDILPAKDSRYVIQHFFLVIVLSKGVMYKR